MRSSTWRLFGSLLFGRRAFTANALSANLFVACLHLIQFFVTQFLNVEHLIACRGRCVDQLVQLEVDRLCIPVLSVLYEEHHEKGDDGCACIDNELPGIGEVEDRAAACPRNDDENRTEEGPLRTEPPGSRSSECAEGIMIRVFGGKLLRFSQSFSVRVVCLLVVMMCRLRRAMR
jgi:hypothetical protein